MENIKTKLGQGGLVLAAEGLVLAAVLSFTKCKYLQTLITLTPLR